MKFNKQRKNIKLGESRAFSQFYIFDVRSTEKTEKIKYV
jgi:hypothetical protein